jgi:hypothetical protein
VLCCVLLLHVAACCGCRTPWQFNTSASHMIVTVIVTNVVT